MDYHAMLQEVPRQRKCLYCVLGTIVLTHVVLMGIVVAILTRIAPEVLTTLSDVNVMVPEMRRTLLVLGRMVPELQTGMATLQKLCSANPDCQ